MLGNKLVKLNKALVSVVPAQSKDSVSDSKAAKISIIVFNLKREYSSRLSFLFGSVQESKLPFHARPVGLQL
jgi:hypothetical protein